MTDLYLQSDGRDMTVWADSEALLTEKEAGPVLWAHLKATLPTRDEPTPAGLWIAPDPDDLDDEALYEGTRFLLNKADVDERVWELLTGLVQPDAPSADERPFKVGDRVRVADDARWVSGVVRGQTVRITSFHEHPDWPSVTVALASGTPQLVHPDDLTHADAPC